ncbi:unnamed protein product [Vitrella brassicaformis CCMP3155]|uniref:Tubulin--tyrosine ligase-like protein 5 n=1 Tax=Vitrella brassicaformis (strain CCMP3155) TaxID=1169540 RepID=A0A0G4GCF9_VITBC|nr:unnamed protein product [Vitrella brassicaformis CCMP3155]|eukprot:CEM26957.1 unnamed protein product [Vitrella brassicaformis CCMP3155]
MVFRPPGSFPSSTGDTANAQLSYQAIYRSRVFRAEGHAALQSDKPPAPSHAQMAPWKRAGSRSDSAEPSACLSIQSTSASTASSRRGPLSPIGPSSAGTSLSSAAPAADHGHLPVGERIAEKTRPPVQRLKSSASSIHRQPSQPATRRSTSRPPVRREASTTSLGAHRVDSEAVRLAGDDRRGARRKQGGKPATRKKRKSGKKRGKKRRQGGREEALSMSRVSSSSSGNLTAIHVRNGLGEESESDTDDAEHDVRQESNAGDTAPSSPLSRGAQDLERLYKGQIKKTLSVRTLPRPSATIPLPQPVEQWMLPTWLRHRGPSTALSQYPLCSGPPLDVLIRGGDFLNLPGLPGIPGDMLINLRRRRSELEEEERESATKRRLKTSLAHLGPVRLVESPFSNRPPFVFFEMQPDRGDTRERGPVSGGGRVVHAVKVSSAVPTLYFHHNTSAHAYNCVVNTLRRSGMHHTSYASKRWNLAWGGIPKPETLRKLNPYQKINHFPNTWTLGRKDLLWRNVTRMKRQHGEAFSFMPQTWILPDDYRLFEAARNERPRDLWIFKPYASSCGRGIRLFSGGCKVSKSRKGVMQKYVSPPLLINGFKFDLRLYVCVTSFDPLRIYLYDEGLVRFATEKYRDLGRRTRVSRHLSSRLMHLTNYSINKYSTRYIKNMDHSSGSNSHEQEPAVRSRFPIRVQQRKIVIESSEPQSPAQSMTNEAPAAAVKARRFSASTRRPSAAVTSVRRSNSGVTSNIRTDKVSDPPSAAGRRDEDEESEVLEGWRDTADSDMLSSSFQALPRPSEAFRRDKSVSSIRLRDSWDGSEDCGSDLSEEDFEPDWSRSGLNDCEDEHDGDEREDDSFTVGDEDGTSTVSEETREGEGDLSPPHSPTGGFGGFDEDDEDGPFDESCSKWSLSDVRQYFKKQGWDWSHVQRQIDDIVVKTLISAEPTIANALRRGASPNNTQIQGSPFPGAYKDKPANRKGTIEAKQASPAAGSNSSTLTRSAPNCFEIYGFDVLLDRDHRAWLLEVNVSPSLSSSSPLDKRIKTALMVDTFNLIRLTPFSPKCVKRDQRNRDTSRLLGKQGEDKGGLNRDRSTRQLPRGDSGASISAKDVAESAVDETKMSRLVQSLIKQDRLDFRALRQEEQNMLYELLEESAVLTMRALSSEAKEGIGSAGYRQLFPAPAAWGKYGRFFETQRYSDVLMAKWMDKKG